MTHPDRSRSRVARAAAGTLAVLGLALAGCGAAAPNAATVNDTELSDADFQDDLEAVFQLGDAGTADADQARSLLSFYILGELRQQGLDEAGIDVSADERATAVDELDRQLTQLGVGGESLPDDTRSRLERAFVSIPAFNRAYGPDKAEVQAAYDADPASAGVLCVRHIVVETEAEAAEVKADLDSGADFEELAKERSIEPAAADTGGALANSDGSACIPTSQFEAQFDPDFVAGAKAAVPGEPTDPVETQFGWHVILSRPFNDIADDAVRALGQDASRATLAELGADADITVNSRYGEWDPEQLSVVAP